MVVLGINFMTEIYNALFSSALNLWHQWIEPLKLRLARTLYSKSDCDDKVSIIIATYNRSNKLIN